MAARALRLAPALGALLLALGLAAPAETGSFNRIPSRGSGGIAGGSGNGTMGGTGSSMGVERRTAPEEPEDERSTDGADAEEAPPPAAAADPDEGPGGDRDAEEAEDEAAGGERTFGRACVYGPRGEVIYAPPGRSCQLERAERRLEAEAARPAAARGAGGARTGRCILGGDGRVLHAPPGVDCTR